jgi:transposase
MWTLENRPRYDRSKLRYPSDLTDEEWALIGPLIPPAKKGGNKRTVDVRAVINGVMYILSTGCQWAALPKDLPPRSTVNDYLRRWDDDRTLDASITRSMCDAANWLVVRSVRRRRSSTVRA